MKQRIFELLNGFQEDFDCEIEEIVDFVNEKEEEIQKLKSKLLDYSDEAFEDFKLAVLKAKEPKEEVKTDEIAKGQAKEWKKGITEKNYIGDYHEEDVHEVATAKTDSFVERMIPIVDQQNLIDLKNAQNELLKEVTWESIQEDFLSTSDHKDNLSEIDVYFVFEWLSKNYNAPTKKQ